MANDLKMENEQRSGIKRVPFSILNYWRMYKARGARLPFYYFFQAHAFDLIHKTDTHKWLPKEYIAHPFENFDNCGMYMASWDCEIKTIFHRTKDLVKNFSEYTFIDIGCGKGKVTILWALECLKIGLKQKIYGIDILPELIEIAKANHAKVLGNDGNFFCEDATKIVPHDYGDKFILYLYNPFDDFVIDKMLDRFSSDDTLIIYNNPVHASFIIKKGWTPIFEKNGFHPNLHTIIFARKS